ncbi:hypothetical protein [uncultured Roseobacter sp.]|uniref:FitA-like ribbon-helix-helix domain-containing protein n=1 Tax=uncultured Roseobacter sp. TaxID=114847 RepID=UPI002633B0C3|nr:hypothetical protein [uncultured Roseobacter sp.]
MGDMTVRNIPEDQHLALKRLARLKGGSAEAEARKAIAFYVEAQSDRGFGSRLHEKYGGIVDQDFSIDREGGSSDPVSFE